MKRGIWLVAIVCLALHFSHAQTGYGRKFKERVAIPAAMLKETMKDNKEMKAVVSGKVASVCQAEGCWMKVETGDGEAMMVRMKGHKFVLPKDIAGKNTTFTGTARVKTLSVEQLKHFAEDEGKSKEYIEAIQQPRTELTFEAEGVIIK